MRDFEEKKDKALFYGVLYTYSQILRSYLHYRPCFPCEKKLKPCGL